MTSAGALLAPTLVKVALAGSLGNLERSLIGAARDTQRARLDRHLFFVRAIHERLPEYTAIECIGLWMAQQVQDRGCHIYIRARCSHARAALEVRPPGKHGVLHRPWAHAAMIGGGSVEGPGRAIDKHYVICALHTMAIARRGPRKREHNVRTAFIAAEMCEFQREGTSHRALICCSCTLRGEHHPGPRPLLQKFNERPNLYGVTTLHMQRHALARRSDHHVLGFKATIEQLLPDVHAVHRLAEAVIGDEHDVGAFAQT